MGANSGVAPAEIAEGAERAALRLKYPPTILVVIEDMPLLEKLEDLVVLTGLSPSDVFVALLRQFGGEMGTRQASAAMDRIRAGQEQQISQGGRLG